MPANVLFLIHTETLSALCFKASTEFFIVPDDVLKNFLPWKNSLGYVGAVPVPATKLYLVVERL